MSVISQCYLVIIDCVIIAPGHGKYVVNVLNAIDKHYIYQLMSNVQLPVSTLFYSQIPMHSSTQNNYVSLTKGFQKHLSKEHQKHGVVDQVK